MTTDVHLLSGAYALDAVGEEESAAFRTHLEDCHSCRTEVAEFRRAAASLGASKAGHPPAHLRPRILTAADRLPQMPPTVTDLHSREDRRRPAWLPRLVAAAAAVAVVGGGASYVLQRGEPDTTLAAPVSQVFKAPDAHTKAVTTARGTVVVATSPSLGKMALDTDQLKSPPQGRVYQMWATEGADGPMTSVGFLTDPAKGAAMEMPEEGVEVAITIEPVGGSTTPTGEKLVSLVPSQV